MKRTLVAVGSARLARWAFVITFVSIAGCGATPALPDGKPTKAPEMPTQFKSSCDPAKQSTRPLVVDWSAPDRAALESQARQGALVVKYEGCRLEVLRRCKAAKKHAYTYTAITPKDEVVRMTSADELHANLPVYAATLEGKLAEKGELSASMRIVGEWGSPGQPPAADQVEGECEGATHLVSALTVGAFRFEAGAKKEAAANVKVLGAGAGASTERSTETLSQDGDTGRCSAAARGDGAPPDGCGALLRLELVPLLAKGEGIPTCGPGTKLVAKKCEPIPKLVDLAPEDKSFTDTEGGKGWAIRCYQHMRSGALPYARAACAKALEMGPDDKTRGAILFNAGLVENKGGDPVGACDLLRRSLAARSDDGVKKKADEVCALAIAPVE